MKTKVYKDFFNNVEEEDTLKEKILYKYYDLVPYYWRPKQIWYQFKCWAWHRYTTFKPRYQGHTWCDKTQLLIDLNFEILCKFIEDEVVGGPVNWHSEPEHTKAYNEMYDLYNWWIAGHKLKEEEGYTMLFDPLYNEVYEILDRYQKSYEASDTRFEVCDRDAKGKPLYYEMKQDYVDEELHGKYVLAKMKLEQSHEEFVNNQLKRIIDLRQWLWT
jgi:hypothetical protein